MDISNILAQKVDELAFLTAIVLMVFFYTESKRQAVQIEKEEMLRQFLNEH